MRQRTSQMPQGGDPLPALTERVIARRRAEGKGAISDSRLRHVEYRALRLRNSRPLSDPAVYLLTEAGGRRLPFECLTALNVTQSMSQSNGRRGDWRNSFCPTAWSLRSTVFSSLSLSEVRIGRLCRATCRCQVAPLSLSALSAALRCHSFRWDEVAWDIAWEVAWTLLNHCLAAGSNEIENRSEGLVPEWIVTRNHGEGH